MKLSYQDIWISEIIRYEIKYSFVSLLYVLCKTKFDILLILRSSSKLANQEVKKWDICGKNDTVKDNSLIWDKWSLIGDTWKKLNLFLKISFSKFELYRSSNIEKKSKY